MSVKVKIYRFYNDLGSKGLTRNLIMEIDEEDDTKIEYILDHFRNPNQLVSNAVFDGFIQEIEKAGYKIVISPIGIEKPDFDWGF